MPSASQEPCLSDASVLHHRDNDLLAALSPKTLAFLETGLKEVSAVQGTVFLEPGQAIDQLYFPQSGMISLLVVTSDGGAIEASTIGKEGAVGLHGGLGERQSFTRASVQVSGRFSTIRARLFREVALGNADIREMIARYTEALWAEAQQVAACNAVHDVSSRLCRWLLQTADRTNGDDLPLTQELLAQMLGVRRTSVTLLAQELQRKGLIKYSRGKIVILDRKGIEACACECYGVIKYEKRPFDIVRDLER